jgi:small subunit ribosomal protein S9
MPRTTPSKKPRKRTLKKSVPKKKKVKPLERKGKEKPPAKKKIIKEEKDKYIEAIGRRKTASARVRIFPKVKEKVFLVNKKELNLYFTDLELKSIILSPLEKTNSLDKFKIEILTRGGGKRGQAEAILLGLSRALVKMNEKLRGVLRAAGCLTRDPRMKERKKFGLKKARRAPQWQKR